MNRITFSKLVIVAWAVASAVACSKSSSSGPSTSSNTDTTKSSSTGTGSGTGLLKTEVLSVQAGTLGTIDSVVYQFQYNSSKQVSGLQQTTISSFSGTTFNTSIAYTYTYSGSLVSSIAGTVNESVTGSSGNYNSTTTLTVTFQSASGKITGYVQTATTTGSSLIPATPENANDSAVITYDGSGNVASYNLYLLSSGSYIPWTQETFTLSGGNMTGTVLNEYVAGVETNTQTSAYTYNSKLPASPYYGIPGVPISSANDVTSETQTTTGINPATISYTYTTTYNSANQPSSSSVAVAQTPANADNITSEQITYTYQ
jgi:hypothetical protein